ncbi:UDP-N-acetylmuramoyl-L-alanine--D-glutamate ligase [Thaumasiovibrio subtropicus]|uniref:UDP-N-acetylmuramoyl-L-alanine--D-glutamate ligase n=1 Tax=Thaumasiovibrio subtropicus TaxID=1891207 RepID=UPI000B360671|nr:UDP-N-acetylmuramoyl-L-alanine--D-glutamate ligase [Thaumasiovibrio subtropicus]
MKSWAAIHKVVVIGLGMTGLSVVRHLRDVVSCHKCEAGERPLSLHVIDTRTQPPGADELPSDVPLVAGLWDMSVLLSADLIVASPGIALATPELQEAASAGIPIVGDIELFAWACDKPVVAITGSNGKSTVTSLVGEMAKTADMKVGVGGNIGFAALDLLAEGHDAYVLELSSFQLETTSSLTLKAAAYLNLSEDHMDRYDSFADYAKAKQRIFMHAERAVVNQVENATWPLQPQLPINTFGFERGQYCVANYQGSEWLMAHGKPVMPSTEIALVGRHNVANCLAALALADALTIPRESAKKAMQTYGGLPHRCQLVHESHGIRWVNDSKATNLASTAAALKGLVLEGRLHLLVGGDGKGADFSELRAILSPMSVTLYCYGRDAEAFAGLAAECVMTETMDEAVGIAARKAQSGDMVLLSPACASFDQFPNFMKRGEHFITLAEQFHQEVSA